MSLRTILIFPQFDNIEIINKIRQDYDPLAELIKPHITLVFPFESQLSDYELNHILDKRLQNTKPFELKLGSVMKQKNAFGNYLFLEVLEGAKELINIHQALYENELKEFDIGSPYVPHMTIGNFTSVESLNNAFSNISSLNDTFHTVVEKILVEAIGENEESIIIIEKELN